MKLSFSARERYKTCPKSYDLHYNQKIRPTSTSSALMFGDAMDKGLNALLLGTGDAFDTFLKGWTNGTINKNSVYLPTTEKLVYFKKDFDLNLLTKEDYSVIDTSIEKGAILSFDIEELHYRKSSYGWKTLNIDEQKCYNLYTWLSLKNKARILLTGYEKEILPRIKKVHAVQKEFSIDNGSGDQLRGFIDLIADIDDHKNVILDHKTSSSSYKADSAELSPQLATYTNALSEEFNTSKVGYIVMKKQLAQDTMKTCKTCGNTSTKAHKTCDSKATGKRCGGEWDSVLGPHYAEFQVIVSEMEPTFVDAAIEEFDNVLIDIKNELFPQNTKSCAMQYGSPCTYRDYCFGGSMEGLTVEKSEEIK